MDNGVPGSSRSARLSIKGPDPGFGAAIRALLGTRFLPLKGLALSRTPDRRSRGSIVGIARAFGWEGRGKK